MTYGTLRSIGFSQVCRQWRAVALDNGTLWAHICDVDTGKRLTKREYPRELFRRSGGAPLIIDWSDYSIYEPSWPTLTLNPIFSYLPELGRIQSLRMIVTWLSTFRQLLLAHNAPAPLLETLTLGQDYMWRDEQRSYRDLPHADQADDDQTIVRFCVDAELFHGVAPRLKELRIVDIGVDPRWPPLSHLRIFDLSCHSWWDAILVDEWLKLLAAMPLLEELVTNKSINPQSVTVTESSQNIAPTVHLAHLQRLHLYENVTALASLFPRLTFSHPQKLFVEAVVCNNETPEVTEMLGLLGPYLAATQDAFATSWVGLHLPTSRVVACAEPSAPAHQAWMTIGFDGLDDTFGPSRTQFLRVVPASFPMDRVVHLDTSCPPYDDHSDVTVSVADWAGLLAHLCSVETLVGRLSQASTIVEALAAAPVCPALHTLTLARVDVRLRPPSGRCLLDTLPRLVTARQEYGLPLRVLQLHEVHRKAIAAVRYALGARLHRLQFHGVPAKKYASFWPLYNEWSEDKENASEVSPCGLLYLAFHAYPITASALGRMGRYSRIVSRTDQADRCQLGPQGRNHLVHHDDQAGSRVESLFYASTIYLQASTVMQICSHLIHLCNDNLLHRATAADESPADLQRTLMRLRVLARCADDRCRPAMSHATGRAG
jgi:hypothetical protein